MSSQAPIIIAHRGFSSENPENTIKSFQASVNAGFNYIELDIHLTADSEIVVMHDETVDRTTDGTGEIKDLSLEQIKKLDAGSWFGDTSLKEEVPTLEEVLIKFRNKVHIFIEIKSEEKELLTSLRNLLESLKWINDQDFDKSEERLRIPGISIISFLPAPLILSSQIFPELDHGLLITTASDDLIAWCVTHSMVGIFPYVGSINKNFIQKAHDSGLYVGAWGFENPKQLSAVNGLGLDGVTVDWPIKAGEILSKEPRGD